MKKCLIIMAIIFSCCMFFSCSSDMPKSNEFIMLSILNDTDGQIRQSFHFTLGSEKLRSNGMSNLEIENVKKELIKNVTLFRDEFYLSFIIAYNTNPNPNYKIGQELLISMPSYIEASDTIGFTLIFSSIETWNYYHPSTGDESGNPEVGFMIKTSSEGAFPFAAKIGEITVGERYKEAYTKAVETVTNKKIEYDPDFVYDYATPLSVIKSDSEYKINNNLHHHIWMRKLNEYKENDKITIYTLQANRGLWYITILFIVLAGLGLTLLIFKLQDRKRH